MRPTTALGAALAASTACIATAGSAQLVTEGGTTYNITLPISGRVAGSIGQGSGTAQLIVNPTQQRVCYKLTFSPTGKATSAHIHRVWGYEPGPIIATLSAPTSGSSAGCTGISRTVANQINSNPIGYYVDVHTVSPVYWTTRQRLKGFFYSTLP